MDVLKAFDSIPHDLIIAKLAAYGMDSSALRLMQSHHKNREQCVCINNKYSSFENIIITIFITAPILQSFASEDTLSTWANTTLDDLVSIVETQRNLAIDWYTNNKVIVNPDKYQAIVLNKKYPQSEYFLLQNLKTKQKICKKELFSF